MKKSFSLIIAVIMLLAVIPFSVSAETLTDEQGVSYTLSKDSKYYVVSGFDNSVADVVIPSKYNGLPVKEIGDSAFEACEYLSSVVIPASVTSIGDWAFFYCNGLTSITVASKNSVYHSADNCLIETATNTLIQGCQNSVIPKYITTIGDSAFYGCLGLTSVVIPDSVTSIGASAFSDCSDLADLTIGNSVTSIGDSAFAYCYSLTSVTIPDSVTSIGESVFEACDGLIHITVDSKNSVYHSSDNCLIETATNTLIQGCQNSIIPNYVTTIDDYAFRFCSELSNIVIPDSVTTIGASAFEYCSELTSVVIPDSVATVGDYTFAGCFGLTSITILDSSTVISDSAIDSCDSLTDVYYETESKPDGWNNAWLDNCDATVHWGYTAQAVEDLASIITEIEALNESDYTSAQWEKIQTALATAKKYKTEGKTAAEIREVIKELKSAANLNGAALGDVNADGAIDQFDYILVKRAYFDTYSFKDGEEARADVNGDNIVDQFDYVLLKRAYFGTYTIG